MMTVSMTELQGLADLCKRYGIAHLKVGDVELDFASSAGPVDKKLVESFNRFLDKGMPTEEDVLFHSAAGYVPTDERPPEPELPKTARGRRS